MSARSLLFFLAKYSGFFWLSSVITRENLCILGYHGISLRDEHCFRPMLFMRPEIFSARMFFLKKNKYRVLTLHEAIHCIQNRSLPRRSVVITIDDGWTGTFSHMAPVLNEFELPATLYLCTYYVEKQTQVFNVAAAYVVFKSKNYSVALNLVDAHLSGEYDFTKHGERDRCLAIIIDFGNSLPDASARQKLLQNLSTALHVDFNWILESNMFSYMRSDQVTKLQESGIDIQLHTHRHQFPIDNLEAAELEIEDNRNALLSVAPGRKNHFCYPSGVYSSSHFQCLRKLGIKSATTCEPGLVGYGDEVLALPRFLDSDDLSLIEFEAELCGFKELLRRIKAHIKASCTHS